MLKVGHRGAPWTAPGNTLESFRAAVRMGCDWVECDCRRTVDGVVVLSHDSEVRDVAGRIFEIEKHPASVLARLNLGAGEGVPSLIDLVDFADGRCGIMADVKTGGCEREIGLALAPLARDAKLAPGADRAGRCRFRELYPDLPLSLSLGPEAESELLAEWDTLDTEAVTLHYSLVTEERVAALQARGIRVFAWTVDNIVTLRKLAAWGIDGLISNRADLLARL